MGTDDPSHTALLTEIRDELREARRMRESSGKQHRRWYEREPFKNMLSHGVVVAVAVGLGWFVHECTGAPVTIEAKASAVAAPTAESTTAASPSASAVATVEITQAEGPMPSATASAASAPARVVRSKKAVPAPNALAYAPAPPPAPPPAVPASALSSPTLTEHEAAFHLQKE